MLRIGCQQNHELQVIELIWGAGGRNFTHYFDPGQAFFKGALSGVANRLQRLLVPRPYGVPPRSSAPPVRTRPPLAALVQETDRVRERRLQALRPQTGKPQRGGSGGRIGVSSSGSF